MTYVSEHPGQDMPLRAVCAAAGVQLPTLYHYFGSKQGLLDEVEKIGFRRFMALKLEVQNSGNFLTDMQIGWDRHIEFAMDNPGLYLLMYGQLQPGSINPGRREPEEYTLELCRKADREGILVVSPELAAAHIMCTCIGAALRFIVYGAVDTVLSRAILEATLDAVTGSDHRTASPLGHHGGPGAAPRPRRGGRRPRRPGAQPAAALAAADVTASLTASPPGSPHCRETLFHL